MFVNTSLFTKKVISSSAKDNVFVYLVNDRWSKIHLHYNKNMRKDMVVNMSLFTKYRWGNKRRYIYTTIKIWENMVVNIAIFTKSGMLSWKRWNLQTNSNLGVLSKNTLPIWQYLYIFIGGKVEYTFVFAALSVHIPVYNISAVLISLPVQSV